MNFSQAADTAAKQVNGGMVVAGGIRVVQGYWVYKFIVVDSSNHTVYKILIDPGNGSVIHKLTGHPMFIGYHHNHCEFERENTIGSNAATQSIPMMY